MAQTWTAKAAADVVERRWMPVIPQGDTIITASAVGSGATVDETDWSTDEVSVTISAGTAGTTANIVVTAVTTGGLSLSETFYLPVRVTAAQLAPTVRDVCDFALRKIVGNGQSANADELADAVERFNDMVALWALQGVDIGLTGPLEAGDTITLPDGYIAALKFNLRIACHDHYGEDISAYDGSLAQTTYRTLTNTLVNLDDLKMPQNLRHHITELTEI